MPYWGRYSGVGLSSSGILVPTYDGIAATRCNIAASGASFPELMVRSGHFARSNITKIKLLLGNYFVNENGGNWAETSNGGPITATASVEYPAGTFNQIKLLGSTPYTLPDLSTVVTDYVTLSVPIPAGAMFWIRQFWKGAGTSYYFGKLNSLMGDSMNVSLTPGVLTDLTMSGTVTNINNSTNDVCFPQGIIAPIPITQPSVWYAGDSIDDGQGDNFDASGDTGFIGRSVGAICGYSSNCVSGDEAHFFKSSNALRKAGLPFCTTASFGHGRNDLASNGSTLTDLKNDLTLCYAGIPANIIAAYQRTLVPGATSGNAYIDQAGQSHPGWESIRTSFNDQIRAGTFGPMALPATGAFDADAGIEQPPLDSGWWAFNGTSNYATSDGTHPNPNGIGVMVAFPVLPRALIY